MKIATVVGARPQFIKAAAVSRVIRPKIEEIIIHTGQHYDKNMSDIFFEELSIPKPDFNLNVGSGSHAKQTGEMMTGIEAIITSEKPDYVMVYGDTNSTLAAALAAVKIHVPIIHVEAGLRSFNMRMPEEVNRILTDRISDYLFCPTEHAVKLLQKEGITKGVHMIGDVMCDAVRYYSDIIGDRPADYYFDRIGIDVLPSWYLATIHRAENTDDITKIENILAAFETLDAPVIFPVHPRTAGMVKALFEKYAFRNIIRINPVGYMDMLFLTKNAEKVVTDSGGLQKEAFLLETECVTVRDQTEWVETLIDGFNVLAKPTKSDIIEKLSCTPKAGATRQNYYGDGHAAEKLLNILRG